MEIEFRNCTMTTSFFHACVINMVLWSFSRGGTVSKATSSVASTIYTYRTHSTLQRKIKTIWIVTYTKTNSKLNNTFNLLPHQKSTFLVF